MHNRVMLKCKQCFCLFVFLLKLWIVLDLKSDNIVDAKLSAVI